MAEFKERPKVRSIKAKITVGDQEETREGASLDDVLRAVVWDIKEEAGWSLLETARRLGLPRTSLQSFMDADKNIGTSLEVLSKICAAIKVNPDALFQSHESYAPENRGSIRFVEDAVFDRFRNVLTTDQAQRILPVLDEMKRLSVLDSQLDIWEKQFPKAHHKKKGSRSPRNRRA